MLLSIGMIVKNEQKYLRNCLTSIKPVLDAVDSELIIFDTGSTDETVQIAKEFTNHVYEIEWRNDFSWARNHTIEKAQGEWFMFVDADEIFTDVTDLISFFNTGEHKKYNCASYRWRNIFGNGIAGEFRPLRLYRMVEGMRFVGKIHECINHKDPLKQLNSIADHYGYDFHGEEGDKRGKEKHERNITLLMEMHEEDPTDTRTIGLIAQDYQGNDHEKSCEYLELGIKLVGNNQDNMHYHVFRYMLIRNYYSDKKYEEVIKLAKKYLKSVKYIHRALVIIHHHYANSLLELNDYKEAAQVAKEALKYFDLNKEGKLDTRICSHAVLPIGLLEVRSVYAKTLVLAATMDANFDTALAYVKECENEKLDVFALYMQHCLEQKSWKDIPLLFEYALKCGVDSDNYHNIISAMEAFVVAPEIKKLIAEAMATSSLFKNKNNDYLQLHILRNANTSSVKAGHVTQSSTADFSYFLKSDKSFSGHYGDVIVYAMKWLTNFSNFAENMVITNSSEFIHNMVSTNEDVPGILKRFIEMGRWDESSVKLNRIISGMANLAFEQVKKAEDEAEKIAFFEMTMRLGHKYLGMVYKSDIYSAQNVMSLSESDAFVFCTGTAYACKDAGDILGFVRNLRAAVAVNPNMKDIVWAVINTEVGVE